MINAESRHQATQQVTQFFDYDHLPVGRVRGVSMSCARLAEGMLEELPDSPELTVGLRKLLEAKDAFVRAAVAAEREKTAKPSGFRTTTQVMEDMNPGNQGPGSF